MGMIPAWSYTRWSDMTTCPAYAYYKHVKKLPTPTSPAMKRGRDIHEDAERMIKTKAPYAHPDLWSWGDAIGELAEQGWSAEEKWGFDADLRSVDFFDPTVWVRGITDAHTLVEHETLAIVDFKTGSRRWLPESEHREQASLFAALGTCQYEWVTQVNVEFWYIDRNEIITWSWSKPEFAGLVDEWIERGRQVTEEETFAETPGPQSCGKYGGCPFAANNGGPCAYTTKGTK